MSEWPADTRADGSRREPATFEGDGSSELCIRTGVDVDMAFVAGLVETDETDKTGVA